MSNKNFYHSHEYTVFVRLFEGTLCYMTLICHGLLKHPLVVLLTLSISCKSLKQLTQRDVVIQGSLPFPGTVLTEVNSMVQEAVPPTFLHIQNNI